MYLEVIVNCGVTDPNAHPASSAASETFVAGGTTVVVPVPSAETSVTVGGNVITLGPGGTPINSLVPATVSQPNAVTPTWSTSNQCSVLRLSYLTGDFTHSRSLYYLASRGSQRDLHSTTYGSSHLFDRSSCPRIGCTCCDHHGLCR